LFPLPPGAVLFPKFSLLVPPFYEETAMTTMLANLFTRLSGRRKEQQQQRARNLRQLVVLIAENENGKANIDDIDSYATLIEESGMSEADLAATVARYKNRVTWSKTVAAAPKKKAARDIADRNHKLADEQEGIRRRKALEELQRMEEAARIARLQYEDTLGAESKLRDTASPAEIESELNAELSGINARIVAARIAVDPTAQPRANGGPQPGYLWSSIETHPGSLARQTKTALAQAYVNPKEKSRLQRQLAAAERAVAERTKELAAIEAEAEKINARLRDLAAEALKPESFSFVRIKETREEASRRLARELGWGQNPPTYNATGAAR
jgi:hypothetical protein